MPDLSTSQDSGAPAVGTGVETAATGNPSGKPIGKVADIGRDIGEYIRQQRANAKISLRQLSKLAGVSNPYLSQIERGVRKPSAEILQQIAKGLRISAEALYIQAGILDLPTGGPVSDSVRADTELTERQKQVLLDVYESFRRENSAKQSPQEQSSSASPSPEGSGAELNNAGTFTTTAEPAGAAANEE